MKLPLENFFRKFWFVVRNVWSYWWFKDDIAGGYWCLLPAYWRRYDPLKRDFRWAYIMWLVRELRYERKADEFRFRLGLGPLPVTPMGEFCQALFEERRKRKRLPLRARTGLRPLPR